MSKITKSEAAYRTGWSIELIEYFISRCPKKGESRKLKGFEIGKDILVDDMDLNDFVNYLAQPWPRTLRLLGAVPELRGDPDLTATNEGISILWLK